MTGATATRSVPEAIVDVLDEAGVPMVLGLAGGYVGTLFEALHDHPRIRTVVVREESVGTMMAEAYGRLRGRPIVVAGQGAWIAGNAGQGLLEALLGSAPVVVVTEMTDGGVLSHHAPYQSGGADFGTWDALGALRAVTKRVMVAHHGAQAVQQTQLALKHAVTGAPGPVAVVLRGSSLKGVVGSGGRLRLHPTSRYLAVDAPRATDAALAGVAAALDRSDRPVVLAGNGVRVGQACDALLSFAEAAGVAVATTSGGKGVVPETHPLAAGTTGTYGHARANSLVAEADLVVAVGTRLAPGDTLDGSLLDHQVIAHIDVEPLHLAWTTPTDLPVVGDAADALTRLRRLVTPRPPAAAAARVAAARATVPPQCTEPPAAVAPFAPRQVIEELQAVWPDHALVTCDAGENRLFMLHWFAPTAPGGYLQPAGSGCMGYAVPAAMGALLADPGRPAVAVCGDGGFAMSLHALMTAVQARLPVGVVVLNNEALGWVLHSMGDRPNGAALDPFDHAAIARAMGCDGARPETLEELRAALATCVRPLDAPYVVDVPTSLGTTYRQVENRPG